MSDTMALFVAWAEFVGLLALLAFFWVRGVRR